MKSRLSWETCCFLLIRSLYPIFFLIVTPVPFSLCSVNRSLQEFYMRSLMFAWLLFTLPAPLRASAFAQDAPVSPQPATSETSSLTWKAALMAGDNELEVFDNATRTLKSMFLRMGLQPSNIRELSASQS